MDIPKPMRIVLLGKPASGKSSLANTILGESIFHVNHYDDSRTILSQSETKVVHGRSLTLIDTHGLFGKGRSRKEVRFSLRSCLVECSPGPHVVLLVFKLKKFTEKEKAIVTQISKDFSADILKHSIVVFTRGEQFREEKTIEEIIADSKDLKDLVRKCGGRCHVFENKYWQILNEYRSNQFQLEQLLKSIDQIMEEKDGSFYTNVRFRIIERQIRQEEANIRQSSEGLTEEEVRKQAKDIVFRRQTEPPNPQDNEIVLGSLVLGAVALAAVTLIVRFLK